MILEPGKLYRTQTKYIYFINEQFELHLTLPKDELILFQKFSLIDGRGRYWFLHKSGIIFFSLFKEEHPHPPQLKYLLQLARPPDNIVT